MKSATQMCTFVLGTALFTTFSAQAKIDTVSVPSLSTDSALALAVKAVEQCQKEGYAVTATVVDPAGRVLAQLRDDKAGSHTLESSRQKAFTAASMKQPTGKLMKLIDEKPILQPLQNMDDNLLLLAGGLPLTVKGAVVGAIGVGGAPGGHLDVACAEAAIKKVSK
ncbi:heme-binding protein [Enterovibrio sp. ZSDZ42]|uniref:Heme-binding protein n=1 Tax=Enterovibrio gelatinilyticus TaxID=2899819 RepID=A0ABT5R6E8_9GAMM|nr:heme-binding protein [Enterovibrio sp. ZSDZ42]MDD1795341.1 heme-binding protein [Enterovibrio sp. ZSDZ42]